MSVFVGTLVACCAALVPAAQAAWTVAPGTVSTTTSQGSAVACTSTTNCLVVGSQSGGGPTSLSSKWNGSTFTKLVPSATADELYGVGCTSATQCVAVGANYAAAVATPHASVWNGTTWAASTVPNPSGSTFGELSSVSCPVSTTCYASGWYTTATTDRPLIDRWTGTTWSSQTVTLPGGTTSAQLSDISCSSATTCTAVGYYDTVTQPRRTMALRWNGTSWSTQSPVHPSGGLQSELQGVTCTAATTCIAVGSYIDATSVQHSLAETWAGGTWTQKTVADPSGGVDPVLTDVSCFSTPSTGCDAVGGYSTETGIAPMAAAWNNTSWALATVPKATGATEAALTGVSCPTSTCIATGAATFDGSTGITGLRAQVYLGP
ncbi:MAG TPA: hypothetical protein VNT55_02200 [Baekduia sp.]|nr:hypothetical protein [Baekduia sp.]